MASFLQVFYLTLLFHSTFAYNDGRMLRALHRFAEGAKLYQEANLFPDIGKLNVGSTPQACTESCDTSEPGPSYLDRPRIHFSGLFQSDVSTVNNIHPHFNTPDFQPVDAEIMDADHAHFNPKGTASFLFRNVKVTHVCLPNAECTDDPSVDPIVGESLDSGISQVTGKMVDLDVDNQLVSTLFGLKMGIRAYKDPPVLSGHYKPAGFTGIWTDVSGQSDNVMSASFQSIIEDIVWNATLTKLPTLRELKRISPNQLSIKFDVRHYHTNDEDPQYTFGYINGTIGPAGNNEPHNFVRGRLLRTTSTDDGLTNLAPFIVRSESKRLTADFGNALGRADGDVGYDVDALGRYICLRTHTTQTLIGDPIDLGGKMALDPSVLEFDVADSFSKVSSELIELVQCTTTGVVSTTPKVLMTEIDVLVRPTTQFVHRLDPGETINYSFFAVQRGLPKCNFEMGLTVTISPDAYHWTPPDKREEALNALKINGESTVIVATNCSGFVTATLAANSSGPGNPRGYVDGELYTIMYCQDSCEPYYGAVGSTLSLQVYDKFTYEGDPSWWGSGDGTDGVYNIFKQYDNLYPVMRPIVVLGDYNSVVANLGGLKRVFSAGFEDPSYMPVTRDLSRAKMDMIQTWIGNHTVNNKPKLGKRPLLDLPGLCDALQKALQVEHATIPTYLYPYYSIKPGSNQKIADIIMSVVLQEMRHVVLAGNVLNAIDADPKTCPPPNLHRKDFIPVYPAPMPGGLRPELTLRLSRLSIGLVQSVFMEIEAPEHQLPVVDVDPDDEHHNTIGGFYRRIERSMKALSASGTLKFKNDTSNQVLYAPGGHVNPIQNLDDALNALTEIVDQGEGTNQTDPLDESGELSHYYRFAQIVYGQAMVYDNVTGKWSFTGDPIPFDPNGVYPIIDDARTRFYKEGSRALLLASGFAHSYLDLLEQLNDIFNGNPDGATRSFSNMIALTTKAATLVRVPVNELGEDVAHAGPPFENPLNLFNEYS